MLLYTMLYIVLAYLMLFAALTNSVCLNNASFFFLFKYFLCQGYELSREIALKNNHYYYYYYCMSNLLTLKQYLMATSCHPNHTKRSIPYSQALRILRICSSKESAKLRCTELVDCLVKRGYNKRKTNKQIERAFTNFANHPTARQCHTTRPVYFNVQFHPGLPDIKRILQRYMPLLHKSVTMKTVFPYLPLISFSQPHNLCRSLCRAKLRQAASVNDEPPRPSQSCGKSRCKLCLSLICSNYISSTANNKTFKCYNENTSCDSKWIIYVISCPICNLQYVGQSNNFRARMNGHKSDFRLYAAGKINKMVNKLLYDHLICHDIDYFHVSIVDMIHVGNNT